jgi:hypothetical protein
MAPHRAGQPRLIGAIGMMPQVSHDDVVAVLPFTRQEMHAAMRCLVLFGHVGTQLSFYSIFGMICNTGVQLKALATGMPPDSMRHDLREVHKDIWKAFNAFLKRDMSEGQHRVAEVRGLGWKHWVGPCH